MLHRLRARLGRRRDGWDEERARGYVGPPEYFDLITAMSFGLLTVLGLRERHRLLDIGCGSLRVGRVLIPISAAATTSESSRTRVPWRRACGCTSARAPWN
ncbi:MAG: hypothetical protein JJE23_09160 [Thermoleophilia bacterium]|jgi:hypothetical protein|nr:hypothetical protein [Thermoleophilia bacterium]